MTPPRILYIDPPTQGPVSDSRRNRSQVLAVLVVLIIVVLPIMVLRSSQERRVCSKFLVCQIYELSLEALARSPMLRFQLLSLLEAVVFHQFSIEFVNQAGQIQRRDLFSNPCPLLRDLTLQP